MKEGGGDGFVRADQIDLKSLDEQLERHLSRAWTLEKRKEEERRERRREEWEIDPSKLLIKGIIARGTFGTVHRGVYDGQDNHSLGVVTSRNHIPLAHFNMVVRRLQVLNGNPYNRKCDVYSFGICLWEIYCCDMPYPDLSFSEITSAVVRQVRNSPQVRPLLRAVRVWELAFGRQVELAINRLRWPQTGIKVGGETKRRHGQRLGAPPMDGESGETLPAFGYHHPVGGGGG
ncbi:hypothetical protein BHE74_00058222 [Ensete ventricosum]|nr:hypothetical protein BHE74_00058222 [Ensete ventricosum]RZR86500.1 hypothetical protein BHM03_00013703 [Ensete ventricosum]